jgi:predicted phage terminase large subunit-like protein
MILILAMLLTQLSTEQIEIQMIAAKMARQDLITFAMLTTPDPADPLDPAKSRFTWKPHHILIARALGLVKAGQCNRLEIELPPRHGKSELSVRKFAPWITGDAPEKSGIIVTHTDTLAHDHGRDCRDTFRSRGYTLTFGNNRQAMLRDDTQAADRLQTGAGGTLNFSGRSGLGAGVGGDWIIFDDFFKNSEEAQSPTIREHAWRQYNSDCKSRLNSEDCPIVMIGSRRHEDDVQGRLFDPTNQHYDAKEAARWTRIRLPALAEASDPLGRKVDEALWPEKFGADFYKAKRNHQSEIVRLDFQTQDQCNPFPADGNYFKSDWLLKYKAHELPKQLRKYGASDHAFRAKQRNDASCLLSAGIDPVGRIFILRDTVWRRMATDELVERMLDLMANNQTQMWWAARDAISGSIEPFLKKRMRERGVYRPYDDSITEGTDLMQRARSIQARMAMGMVLWPEDWPQLGEAFAQLLAFPNGKHDDLVAALAMLGMGLDRMIEAPGPGGSNLPKKGTWAWHTHGQNVSADEANAKGWA